MKLVHALTAQPMSIDEATFQSLLVAAWRHDQQHGDNPQANLMDAEGRRDEPRIHMVGNTAVLPLTGLLMPSANIITRYFGGTSTQLFERDFRQALGDSRVRKIVLLADSPGGSALGNEEVAQTIYEARGVKPIDCFVRGMCASACYYIGSAASRIIASPSSPVGSIGTILFHTEFSKFYADLGVTVNVIRHGENKGHGNQDEALSPKARATLQEFVDNYGNQFDEAVARQRGVTVADVRGRFGQGKVFLAEQARQLGMIDAVGKWDDVVTAADGGAVPTQVAGFPGVEAAFDMATCSLLPGWDHAQHTLYTAADKIPVSQSDPPSTPQDAGEPNTPVTEDAQVKISKNLKAAMYLFGCLQVADVEKAQALGDDVCWAALNAWFAARGEEVPDNEAEILKALKASGAPKPTQQTPAPSASESTQQANPQAPKVDAEQILADDRERRKNIRASGELLGMSAEDIRAAEDSNQTFGDILTAWHEKKAKEEQPVASGDIEFGPSSAEKLCEAATIVLLDRCGYGSDDDVKDNPQARQASRELQHAPLLFFARAHLQQQGVRLPQFASGEQIAKKWLQCGGIGEVEITASSGAFNRPADFPNLLSNLANKILDRALPLASPTYPKYSARMSDVPDFKPRTITGLGVFDELDAFMDDEEITRQLQMVEELKGWIAVDRFRNKVGLTPVMIANDDLDSFAQGLQSLTIAHENTLNRLHLGLLTSNVTLADGVALYHSNHGNLVTDGGAPAAGEATKMRNKLHQQSPIAGNGKVRVNMAVALVPTNHMEAAEQTFLSQAQLAESLQKTGDTSINVHRGRIEPVEEPELDDYSTDLWYGFADPRILRTFVHMFQTGYGRGGMRTSWMNPENGTRYVGLEGRMGAAIAGYRGTVQNDGVAEGG